MSRFSIALVFVVGCSSGTPGLKGLAPTGAQEQAVAKHILETANDPKSVEFVKWGPHAVKQGIYRVCTRGKAVTSTVAFLDFLYFVDDGTVRNGVLNSWGEGWNQPDTLELVLMMKKPSDKGFDEWRKSVTRPPTRQQE